MPECTYCGEQVHESDNDQEYLTHLVESHGDELGAVDTKRVETQWDGDLEEALADDPKYSALTLALSATFIVFVGGMMFATFLL